MTLTCPATLADAPTTVELVDPEGLPLARVAPATGEVDRADPRAVRPVPPPLPHRRARSASSTPAARSCPVTDALTDAQLDELRGLGPRACCSRSPAPAPPPSPPSRWSAPPCAAADLLDDAVGRRRPARRPRRRRRRPRARRPGRRRLRRRRPGPRPALVPTVEDGALRPTSRRRPSSTADRPPPERAGPGAVLHRPVRQRQVHAGPGADGPRPRAGRAHASPASTATSYAGTSRPG